MGKGGPHAANSRASASLVRVISPAPHSGHAALYELLVEEAPDENVAEARVGIFLQPARSRPVLDVVRQQRPLRIGLVEIGADGGGIAQREIPVDQHGDSPKRAQPLELFAAEEGRDRLDLVGEPLRCRQASTLRT